MTGNNLAALESRLNYTNNKLSQVHPSDKDYKVKVDSYMSTIRTLEAQIRDAKSPSSHATSSPVLNYSPAQSSPSGSTDFAVYNSPYQVTSTPNSFTPTHPSPNNNTSAMGFSSTNIVPQEFANGTMKPRPASLFDRRNTNAGVARQASSNLGFPSNGTTSTNHTQQFNPTFSFAHSNGFQPRGSPPKQVYEVVELSDSDDDEPMPDRPINNHTTSTSAQPPSNLTAPTTTSNTETPVKKRDLENSENVIDLTADDSLPSATPNKRSRTNSVAPPPKLHMPENTEVLESNFLSVIFPTVDKLQKSYATSIIKLLKDYKLKYTTYYRTTNDQWKVYQEKITALKGQSLNETENSKLQEYITNAKYSWEMKNLYSRYREYYSDSLNNILSTNNCNYKKYYSSLVQTIKKLEDQATRMPKILMEQSAIKNMKMARETATTDPQQQFQNPFGSNYSAPPKSHSMGNLFNSAYYSHYPPQNGTSTPSSSRGTLFSRPNSMNNMNNFPSNPYTSSFRNSGHPGANTVSESQRNSLFDIFQNMDQSRVDSVPVSSVDKEELEKLLNNISVDDDISPEEREGTPDCLSITLLEHQKIGLTWLLNKENTLMGGILADDMGLGKTIQMISLIVSKKSSNPDCKTTLVITPVALLKQWEREFHTRIKADYGLSVYVHHGSSRKNKTFDQLKKFDVVLTTYGVIAKEHKEHFPAANEKKKNTTSVAGSSPFFQTTSKWYRIVLDEAQLIKNKSTISAKACCALDATYRWCLSGTPMQNNVLELQSLIKFLRIQPYNDERKFSFDIAKPLEKYSSGASSNCTNAMKKLQAILKAIMLRRTKKTMVDGKPILQLPAKKVTFETHDLSSDEREYYNHLENGAIQQMNKYLVENTIAKNYSNILVMLLRLRQACCHPKIVERAHLIKQQATLSARSGNSAVQNARKLSPNVVQRIKNQTAFQCPLCFDAIDCSDILLFSPCGHHVCADCCAENFQQNGDDINSGYRCPSCNIPVNEKGMMDYIVFEWVHIKGLSDASIRFYRQSYRETASVKRNNTSQEQDSQKDDKDKVNAEAINYSDDDSIFDTKPQSNSVKAEEQEVKNEEVEKANMTNTFVKGDPDEMVKAETSIDPNNKYSKKVKDESTDENDMIGPRVPRDDLAPCFPRGWVSSTKIQECLNIIKHVQKECPGEKILVFSQFMSLLDFVEVAIALETEKICYGRYDGSMSSVKRNDTVTAFFDDPEFSVLLISLKAGNVGLTLTAASHIIILDPFWNPFVEEQAMDRAHRIGQLRPVYVHRLFIKESVEDRILALQEKKRLVIDAALDEKEIRNTLRLNQNELLYLFGLNSRGQRSTNMTVPT